MDFSIKMDWKNEFIHFQNQDKSIAIVNFALRVYFFVSQSQTLPSKNALSDGRRRQDTED